MNDMSQRYDLILSFDHGDCARYNLKYHPLVFSNYNDKPVDMPNTDIYFLGRAKDRLQDILKAYTILKEEGLVLDFNLVGVNEKEQKYNNEINYIKGMSYHDNLQHIAHTKCVFEIMQKGGCGFTQRGVEVVGMNKKLLTNNPMVIDAPFYNSEFISRFESINNIDKQFIRDIKKDVVVNYNYKEHLSPLELLSVIDVEI